MNIVFIGCVEIGLKGLKQVLKDGWEVKAIFTLAKKNASRTSGFVDFSPIAKKNKIALYKVNNLNYKVNIKRIHKIKPDLIIVSGWQRLICKEILDIPNKGTVGFHSSLLPQYRGRAPVNWAMIMGAKKTGITMFFCDQNADTGDIIAQKSVPITLEDTCATVYEKLAKAASGLLHKFLPGIAKEEAKRVKNTALKHKFWPKRKPEDGRINWNSKALDVHNWIRALTHPYPGAFTYYKGKKYFIWSSKLGSKKKGFRYRPGQIIDAKQKNKRIVLSVATGDNLISIYDIAGGKKKLKNDFVKGAVLV
jgi:methionyl-tRNA formyltransferase